MSLIRSLTLATLLIAATPALAEEAPKTDVATSPLILTIKDHKFSPEEIKVPANTPFSLRVKNEDASAEEFESEDLEVEKVIAGNTEAIINIPALDAGSYSFVGEFNEASAKGKLIAE